MLDANLAETQTLVPSTLTDELSHHWTQISQQQQQGTKLNFSPEDAQAIRKRQIDIQYSMMAS